jgi:hypothetical protein
VAPPDGGDTGSSREELTSETIVALSVVSRVAQALDGVAARAEAEDPSEVPAEGPMPVDPTPAPIDEPGAGACTRLEWNIADPLRLTIHFEGCTTSTGEPLNGSITGWLRYGGTEGAIGVELGDLQVGAHRMGGFVILSGDGASETVMVEADVYLESPEGTVNLELAAAITAPGGNLTIDGSARFVKDDGDDWSAVASSVAWENPAVCHPTSGALDLSSTGWPPTHVTLRARDMLIQVGTLPPFTYPYAPCP